MKFAIASVSYWDSIGLDSTKWRKSLDGTKALCHLSYAERLGINLHATPEVTIYDNVDTEFEELLSSPEWSETSATGDPDSFSILNELNQFETNINNAVSQKTADLTAQLQQTEQDLTDQMNTAVGAVTVDSEVVLARGAENTLGNRLDSIEAEFYDGFDVRLGDLESDRVVLKNLIANGDFSDGDNGWTRMNSTLTIVGGRAFITPTATYGGIRRVVTLEKDNKYYLSGTFEGGANAAMLVLGLGQSTALKDSVGLSQLGIVFTSPDTETRQVSLSARGDDFTPFYADDILLIDLTSTFGVGKEPSKEWMDRLIEQTGYFDEYSLDENWQVQELMRMDNVKANKQQENWITPTLLNGFTERYPVGYMKDNMGVVHFKGVVQGGAGDTVFTLPNSYSPDTLRNFVVGTAIKVGDQPVTRVYISVNGAVRVNLDVGNVFYLDQISFYVGGII